MGPSENTIPALESYWLAPVRSRPSRIGRATVRFIRTKPLAAVGGGVIVFVLLVAVFANSIATYDPNRTDPVHRLEITSSQHYLGTDNLGRDIYSRLVEGARVSVLIATITVLIATTLATIIGGLAGFVGGKVDMAAQRLVDIMLSFPPLVLLVSVLQFLPRPTGHAGIGPFQMDAMVQKGIYIVITLGILVSIGLSRVIRSSVITVKTSLYIEGARAAGATNLRIFVWHVLPNIFPVILTIATASLGAVILIEASISFLGVGMPPDSSSWGIMLSEGRNFINRSFNITLWPGIAIAITVFGFNMFGDGLRDVLDPRLRGSR